jgi:hypothetical protein
MKPLLLVVSVGMPLLAAGCGGLVAHPGSNPDAGGGATSGQGGSPPSSSSSGGTSSGGSTSGGGGTSSGGPRPPLNCIPTYPCTDFPELPGVTCANGDCVAIDDSGPLPVPSNPGALFANPSASGGPCVVEPADGTLFPNAFLRPRISFAPATGSQNIFQIRLHSDSDWTTSSSTRRPRTSPFPRRSGPRSRRTWSVYSYR